MAILTTTRCLTWRRPAMKQAIMREFSAAIRATTRCAPSHELAAILAGLKRQRRAALVAAGGRPGLNAGTAASRHNRVTMRPTTRC